MSTRKPYPSDVTDDEWAFVAPYLSLLAPDALQRKYDLREVYNGLRWLVRTGAQWRMLPHDFPLLEARRRRSQQGPLAQNDRRVLRSRRTRLAIVETLRVLQHHLSADEEGHPRQRGRSGSRVTALAVADYLDLHRNTVSKHLQQLRALGIIDQDNVVLETDGPES